MTIGKVKQRNINLLDCHVESRLRRESMNCNETSLDSARDDTKYILLLMFPDTQYIFYNLFKTNLLTIDIVVLNCFYQVESFWEAC
jgi:hypothetical protein